MNEKKIYEFWISEDGNDDPVLKAVAVALAANPKAKMPIDLTTFGGRPDFMRAYCISMLLAKALWNAGFPPTELDRKTIISALPVKKSKGGNFVVTMFNAYNKSNDKPEWYARLQKSSVSDPLHANFLNRKKKERRVYLKSQWSDHEWEFATVTDAKGASYKPVKDHVALAKALEKFWPERVIEKNFGTSKVSINIQQNHFQITARESQPDTAAAFKTEFDTLLAKTMQTIAGGEWLKAKADVNHPHHKEADIGGQIGASQREKELEIQFRRDRPIKGDWKYLLESTHKAMAAAERRWPDIGRAFDFIVDAVELIDKFQDYKKRHKDTVQTGVSLTDLSAIIPPPRIYLFLLYFTYLKIECPQSDRTKRSARLLRKHRFFSLMSGHVNGVNDCFFRFLGTGFFCRKGERFPNRYYYEVVIQPDDTLKKIINRNYIDSDNQFAECLEGMRQYYPWLRDVLADDLLLPIAKRLKRSKKIKKTAVCIAPPSKQNNSYQEKVQNIVKDRETKRQ